ncbi:glycosylphosphatidylinositol transamidase [Capronia coronata CBS 617.96]|uniref:Glycosylphosphatidylinositol transamidase n=1 Tax=Capronia coronata CBS 617.96 TaxID=1182541 RepID=W9YPZ3_9EURO|nr:glycosylphosphatidylinositol transamidase [Capronia coronata CBS 617.96]EXJ94628.1 glycosylphosphatidylinositol transamidase [Capronia coronata CBS 617.96]
MAPPRITTNGLNLPLPTRLINISRLRSYLLRLPLFTRLILLAIVAFWVLDLQTVWSVIQWGSLTPKEVGFGSMYRLNTFPLIHMGFWHMLLDTACLIPLLERFEAEWGTLNSLALFMGPLGQIPAALYLLVDGVILRDNTPVLGASIWVFLLLASEAIKTYKVHPFIEIAGYNIPTWISPLALLVVTSVLIPNTSFLGHLCGCVTGYLWGLGYIRFLAPPEKVLRWIEGKFNLLGRLPHYVSVDQQTYGRYGVLPSSSTTSPGEHASPIGLGWVGGGILSIRRTAASKRALTWASGNSISRLRKDDPRLLRIPPYLSALCILGGIIWILLLPLNEYSRQTYISENALLPGQVHTYFGGSEQNVFRAYRHELATVSGSTLSPGGNETSSIEEERAWADKRNAKIQELFRNAGLKTARQRYSYTSSGQTFEGENVYAVLHAPRGDGTEAIVLLAPLKNIDDALNVNGVPLLISLARYFKRWSLWSKDIIFLVTPDSFAGPQAWIDAYHSTHDPRAVEDLSLKSGALQAAVCIDYPFEHRFETLHIAYDGVNGALPNLDLFNTAVTIASGQMGIGTSIQFQHTYTDRDSQSAYPSRLQILVRGMASQALGQATGPHSSFMTYHIDAITLTAIGQGWQDEMAFGRTVESICRSLNNLLEKLHQSFFFYLLMQSNRFVSIGTYLPSAMIIAAAYTFMAIYLWVLSGYRLKEKTAVTVDGTAEQEAKEKDRAADKQTPTSIEQVPKVEFISIDRNLILPIALLAGIHLASLIPLYLLTSLTLKVMPSTFFLLALFSIVLPIVLASALPEMPNNTTLPAFAAPTNEQYVLIKSLSLLLLGLFLTVLATLNFSLSMFLGIACVPLAFVDRMPGKKRLAVLQYLLLLIFSPMGLAAGLGVYEYFVSGQNHVLVAWLQRLAFGWNVWSSWGVPVGVLCIWLPAWIVGATLVASSWFSGVNNTTSQSPAAAQGRRGVVKHSI